MKIQFCIFWNLIFPTLKYFFQNSYEKLIIWTAIATDFIDTILESSYESSIKKTKIDAIPWPDNFYEPLNFLTNFLEKNSSFYTKCSSLTLYHKIDTCDVIYLRIIKNVHASSFLKTCFCETNIIYIKR